ncbi:caspase domain-containing protein [Mycena vitilis]|nr:caspase domain-containing protein [Mycena vitilis]
MPPSVFGLIIGVDQYQSGSIWNLEVCASDAKNVQRWVLKDLKVPSDHLCMLLDKTATKANIEKFFMNHLIQNPKIEPGDAIIIYFAGHGTSVPAPESWDHPESVSAGTAAVLCSYDYGRGVAGISDRSLHAMLLDLWKAKGDNITVILDSCFSPITRDRNRTRWTPSGKTVPQDLSEGLWPTASPRNYPRDVGFYNTTEAYTLLAACSSGERAMEGKEGGSFTSALLETAREIPLHNLSCAGILRHVRSKLGADQCPIVAGLNAKRPIFNAVPFIPDNARYFQTDFDPDSRMLRTVLGAIHGVVVGTEFSVHSHNYCGSCNPPIASVSVTDVYATWSFAHSKSHIPPGCWVRVRKWNNRGFFGVGLPSKKSSPALRRPSRASLQSMARSLLLIPNL